MFGMESWVAIALLVLFLVVFIFLFILAVTVSYKIPQELFYGDCPSLVFLYMKALFVALGRKQGQFQLESDQEGAPEVTKDGKTKIVARDCRIDKSLLTQYAIVCSYGDEPLTIPPCYLETYFMPLMIALASSEKFKLSPLGLIHIRQTITQHSDIQHLLREPFDLECTIAEYRRTHRGIEVDFTMKVYDRREMCMWEGVSTLLSRGKRAAQAGQHSGQVEAGKRNTTVLPVKQLANESRKTETMVLRIPGNLGVKYARASGDWNPHHLWPWTAKVLGYRKPIAHGMWTMARCLTWLDRSGKFVVKAPFHVDVHFKRPIFLPDSSVFTFQAQLDNDTYAFHVNDERTQVPQLLGRVTKRL